MPRFLPVAVPWRVELGRHGARRMLYYPPGRPTRVSSVKLLRLEYSQR
jgi:hypothetical protein